MEAMNELELTGTLERLAAAAERLEASAERFAERQAALVAESQDNVGRIVATVDSARELEMERRLEQAEARIAELSANASGGGRKTLAAGASSLLAKQGVTLETGGAVATMEATALDGALAGLSIEQRIAVKAELMRVGLLG